MEGERRRLWSSVRHRRVEQSRRVGAMDHLLLTRLVIGCAHLERVRVDMERVLTRSLLRFLILSVLQEAILILAGLLNICAARNVRARVRSPIKLERFRSNAFSTPIATLLVSDTSCISHINITNHSTA